MRQVYIREWREYRGLTQEVVAARIGKSHTTLGRIENAKTHYKEDWLVALADIYECTPADLISRHPTRDPKGMWSIYDSIRGEAQQRLARALLLVIAGGT